jgi:uncharacterized protein YebE (UPF0316 family)
MNEFFAISQEDWTVVVIIFSARILDVSLGTLRAYFLTRGFKKHATFFGFFESITWILAIGQIFKNVDSPLAYIAYAGGYASGTFIGMIIAERLNVGNVILRLMPKNDVSKLIEILRANDFRVTVIHGEGRDGKMDILFSVINRKRLTKAIKLINSTNPNAFFTIEEVRKVNEGLDLEEARGNSYWPAFLNWNRK